MTIEHNLLGNADTKSHGIVWKTVPDAAGLAALAITAADIAQKKVVKQTDTGELWIPVTVAPTFELLFSGSPANNSLLTRFGNAIVAATFSAGLSMVAGGLTLAPVSNLTQGAAPAITAASAVLTSNGAGTAAVWAAPSGGGSPVGSGRAINTTAPLAGGGTLAADLTLTVAAVSNTTSGVAPITNATAGQALISSATTTAWSTNFQAQSLVTTNSFVVNSSSGFFRSGLAAGSGAGSAAATGDFRIRNDTAGAGTGWFMNGRNTADAADVVVLSYGTNGAPGVQLGGVGMSTATVIATSINFIGSGTFAMGLTAGFTINTASVNFLSTVTNPVIAQVSQTAAGNTLTIAAQQSLSAAGGNLVLGSGQGATGTTSGTLVLKVGTNAVLSFNATPDTADFAALNVVTTGFVSIGATPSTASGSLRVNNSFLINGRNAANSANLTVLSFGISSANGVLLGDATGSSVNVDLVNSTGVNMRFGTTIHARFGSSILNFFPAAIANFDVQSAGSAMIGFAGATTVRNIALFAAASTSFQSGDRVLYMVDRTAAPTGNPSGGGYHWMGTGGLPTWRNVAGDVLELTLTSAATANAGAGILPATPQEFMTINYKGNVRKIPLYLT